MDELRQRLKVDTTPVIGKNVQLIMQYIEKEKVIQKQFDEDDGIDVNAEDYKPEASVITDYINSFLNYRNIRTEQAYISRANDGNNSREVREMLAKLDEQRRRVHNRALSSMIGINRFAKMNGLEPIYTGRMLTEEEIQSHDPLKNDVREEMTNAMLKLLIDIETYSLQINEGSKEEILEFQRNMGKFNRDYGVEKPLKTDEGDIIFKDFNGRAV